MQRPAPIATLILTIGSAVFVSLSSQDLVALLGVFGWGTFAAALVPAVAIGFNWKRATPLAVNVAIVSSLVINFSIGEWLGYLVGPGKAIEEVE